MKSTVGIVEEMMLISLPNQDIRPTAQVRVTSTEESGSRMPWSLPKTMSSTTTSSTAATLMNRT